MEICKSEGHAVYAATHTQFV
jgi:hypothetical protein